MGIGTTESLTAVETFRRLHPRTYLERFLAEDIRPDGRGIGDFRDVSVNIGTSSSQLHLDSPILII